MIKFSKKSASHYLITEANDDSIEIWDKVLLSSAFEGAIHICNRMQKRAKKHL